MRVLGRTIIRNALRIISNLAKLANGKIWIGDASGIAQEQTMGGEVTITAAGTATVAATHSGSAHHTRAHAITGTSDHTSSATSGQMLKANANGLPVDATNTDSQVASAVSASHARSHALDGTLDHSVGSLTANYHVAMNAGGTALVNATNTDAQIAAAVTASHAAATAGTGISVVGQQITNSDTGSGAVGTHEGTYTHSDIALNTAARHVAITLAADADTLLGLSTQQITLDTQTAGTVLAGPASGVAADPTFRALVNTDVADHTHADADNCGQLDWDTCWADAVHTHTNAAEGGTLGATALDIDNLLPWIIDIDCFQLASANTNWDAPIYTTANLWNGYNISSGAQNDSITWNLVLAAGTWRFELFHVTGTNRGIYSLQFDSVEKGTIDGYASPIAYDVRGTVSNITVSTTAKIAVKLKMATKNGSSSSYYGLIEHARLTRTA